MNKHTIPRLTAQDSIQAQLQVLEEAGCLVVTGLMDQAAAEAVRAELAPHMAAVAVNTGDDADQFYPGHTRRVTSLVARSGSVRNLTMHPLTEGLCDHFLLPNCEERYQLHVTAALEVGPGARKQVLHREEDPFAFFPLPRPNLVLATMWAISDFSADNGGTLLVPGSHRWAADRQAQPEEIVSAEMPAGSVLFWLGGTLHGAGANVSDGWRYGVILTYSLGWLRQEENQSLAVPRQVAESLSPELRDLIGETMNGSLGFSEASLPDV